MKKSKLSIVLASILVLGSVIFYACNKELNTNSYPIPKNETIVLNGSNTVDVRVSDVSSSLNKVVRKIEYLDKRNNSVIDTYIITLSCDNPNDNIYEKVKSGKLSGTMSIENNNNLIGKSHAINGLVTEKLKLVNNLNSCEDLSLNYKVALSTALDCVEAKIDNMNWLEYAACLLEAPRCYGLLWVACLW